MKGSGSYSLNRAEVERWIKNILVFSSPIIILALTDLQNTGSINWKMLLGVAIQATIDLLRKWSADNTKRII